MVVTHRQGRVFAMQVLYGLEINGGTPGDAVTAVLASDEFPKIQQAYGMNLVDRVLEHRGEYDATLAALSVGWDMDRMAILDRILIIQCFAELSFVVDVPVRVVLQEAVQIANKYSTEQSGLFVNGILDRFARDRKMLGEKNND
jgi:N utilization substance protein B